MYVKQLRGGCIMVNILKEMYIFKEYWTKLGREGEDRGDC